jgi:sodium transport system permease protein
LRNIWLIFRKEVTYALRDQDVLIYGVFFPLLAYPILTIGVTEFFFWLTSRPDAGVPKIALVERVPPPQSSIIQALEKAKDLKVVKSAQPFKDLAAGKIDAVLDIDTAQHQVEVTVNQSFSKMGRARLAIETSLAQARSQELREQMKSRGISDRHLNVFTIDEDRITAAAGTSQAMAMNMTGGMHPVVGVICALVMLQICLTASVASTCMLAEEREKKTLATTLLLPVSINELIAGKFCAAGFISLLSGLINIFSIVGSFSMLFLAMAIHTNKLKSLMDFIGLASIQPKTVILVTVAIVFSLIFMIATYFVFIVRSKTFKEAQTIVTIPLLLLFPLSLISFVPGLELNYTTAFIPVLNVFLIAKRGETELLPTMIAISSILIFSALLLFFVGKLFARDERSPDVSPRNKVVKA